MSQVRVLLGELALGEENTKLRPLEVILSMVFFCAPHFICAYNVFIKFTMSLVVIGASPNLFDIIKRVNEDEQTQQLPLCLDNSAIHDRLRRYGFVRYRFWHSIMLIMIIHLAFVNTLWRFPCYLKYVFCTINLNEIMTSFTRFEPYDLYKKVQTIRIWIWR